MANAQCRAVLGIYLYTSQRSARSKLAPAPVPAREACQKEGKPGTAVVLHVRIFIINTDSYPCLLSAGLLCSHALVILHVPVACPLLIPWAHVMDGVDSVKMQWDVPVLLMRMRLTGRIWDAASHCCWAVHPKTASHRPRGYPCDAMCITTSRRSQSLLRGSQILQHQEYTCRIASSLGKGLSIAIFAALHGPPLQSKSSTRLCKLIAPMLSAGLALCYVSLTSWGPTLHWAMRLHDSGLGVHLEDG